jgi:hypothetical protein
MKVPVARALGVLALALAGQAVSADMIISNLNANTQSSTLFGPNSTTVYKAAGFTMPNQDYYLDEVVLKLYEYETGEARISIWDGVGAPQNELLVLNNAVGQGPGEFDYSFTAPSQFTLMANTTYWVYVEATGMSGDWNWTSVDALPSGLASHVNYLWNGSPSSFWNSYGVYGREVPLPGSLALLGLGALVARRR